MNILKQLWTGERNLPGAPFTQKELDAEIALVKAESKARRTEQMKNWKNLVETWEKGGVSIKTTAIEGMQGHYGDILNGHLMMAQYGWKIKSSKTTPFKERP